MLTKRTPRRSTTRKYSVRSLKGTNRAWNAELAARFRKAMNGQTIAAIAQATGDHPENIRRHLINGRISAKFLWAFCQAFGVDPMWMLSGKGKMKSRGSR